MRTGWTDDYEREIGERRGTGAARGVLAVSVLAALLLLLA